MRTIYGMVTNLTEYNKEDFDIDDDLINKLFYETFNYIGGHGLIRLNGYYNNFLKQIYNLTKNHHYKSYYLTNSDNQKDIIQELLTSINDESKIVKLFDTYQKSSNNLKEFKESLIKYDNDNFLIDDGIYKFSEELLNDILNKELKINICREYYGHIILIINDINNDISSYYYKYLSKKYNLIIFLLNEKYNNKHLEEVHEYIDIIEKYQNDAKDNSFGMIILFNELNKYLDIEKYDLSIAKSYDDKIYFYCDNNFKGYRIE